jgi:hypothetical protein
VEEADQVEEVQEEVSYPVVFKLIIRTRRTTKSRGRRKRRTRARSTKRRKRKGTVGNGNGKEIIYSHRDRYHRCQYYADSYESAVGCEAKMGMFVG